MQAHATCRRRPRTAQVLRGEVQIRTKRREPFDNRLKRAAPERGRDAGADDGAGAAAASEDEMLALFQSIDADGSGGARGHRPATALRALE